jgi:hypothetical protein
LIGKLDEAITAVGGAGAEAALLHMDGSKSLRDVLPHQYVRLDLIPASLDFGRVKAANAGAAIVFSAAPGALLH